MLRRQTKLIAFLGILIVAAAFRVSVAHWLPNDAPDDGRVYAQMARNVLERHVYSHDSEPPYAPSLIRLPGYPLFLAAIYSVFGHANNGAVRLAQALMDTATCALVALLAWLWQPDAKRKFVSAVAALALAAVCPFTTIYAATILTEVPTNFLVMAMMLAATLAFRNGLITADETTDQTNSKSLRRALLWWSITGLLGGLAVLMRPDNGLFLAAVGLTLVISGLVQLRRARAKRSGSAVSPDQSQASTRSTILRTLAAGAVFSIAFALVLAPWAVRNWRVFHLFQPLSPAHGEMPGEFVPRGYNQWLRTWVDDDRYIAPFLWSLDSEELDIDEVPASAFDSAEERNRVAALFDKYNHAGDQEDTSQDDSEDQDSQDTQSDQSSQTDQPDESQSGDQQPSVEMTPEIDAAFGQLARERIARHRFRYYVWLPIQRARAMWFDTHSQYWPFEGTLRPLEDLDYEHHQHIWLPLFAGLTALYSLWGLAGGLVLSRAKRFGARRWLLLATLAMLLRLVLFSSIENPEPRYLVEFFPFLSVLGGIAMAKLLAFFVGRSARRSLASG